AGAPGRVRPGRGPGAPLLRAGPRAQGRRVLRRPRAVRHHPEGAHRPAGLPPGRARVRRVRRRRHPAGGLLPRSVQAPEQARWRLDGQLRRAGRPGRHDPGDLQRRELHQARARPAGAAELRRRHHPVPRVRPRPARPVLQDHLPEPVRHQRAARLRRVPLAVQRALGALPAGVRQLRPPLPDRRADAEAAAGQDRARAHLPPGLRHHRVPGRLAAGPGPAPAPARPHQPGDPMPTELVEKIVRARTFNQGSATPEYLAASLLDLAWHLLPADARVEDVDAFENQALARYTVDLAAVPPRYRSNYFAHVRGGGYAAGHHAYFGAEVLDHDAFKWFEENGGLTRENGKVFREKILSIGHSRDLASAYREFRGKDPSVEPLLEFRGLK